MPPPATQSRDRSASRSPARPDVLPVAEIFHFERVEVVGLEALVTVVVGDAEHEPHLHGLRAPEARWVEIFAALATDPAMRERLHAALAGEAPPAWSPRPIPLVVQRPAARAPETAPAAEPGNVYERRPVGKPSGALL